MLSKTLSDKPVAYADILRALNSRYPSPSYLHLFEVRNAAGFQANRSTDVVIVGIWPSRGLSIRGVEIKMNRPDWLRELAKPEKQEASLFRYCDEWYLVTTQGVVSDVSEVPDTWGFLEYRSAHGKLAQLRAAPSLQAEPVNRNILITMLRRASDLSSSALAQARDKGFLAGQQATQKSTQKSNDALLKELKELAEFRDEVRYTMDRRGLTLSEFGKLVQKMSELELLRQDRSSMTALLEARRRDLKSMERWVLELATSVQVLERLANETGQVAPAPEAAS